MSCWPTRRLESATRTVVLWLRAQLAYQTNALRDGERFLDEPRGIRPIASHDLRNSYACCCRPTWWFAQPASDNAPRSADRRPSGESKRPLLGVTVQRTSTRVAVDWKATQPHPALSTVADSVTQTRRWPTNPWPSARLPLLMAQLTYLRASSPMSKVNEEDTTPGKRAVNVKSWAVPFVCRRR